MASSIVDICNAALAEVPAREIAAFDENSLEARECRRSYAKAKEMLLEMPDRGWSFARSREALAAVANDRSTEWGYAYRLPPNKKPLGVVAVAVDGAAYTPLAGQTLSPIGTLEDRPADYTIVGETIYTNIESAYLSFTDTTVTEPRFPALFVRALELELACRLVLPITKDRARWRELKADAKVAIDRAMASDLNREPQRYMDHIPDTILARG